MTVVRAVVRRGGFDVRFGSKASFPTRPAMSAITPQATAIAICQAVAKCQKPLRGSFAHTDNRCSLSLDRQAECAEIALVGRRRGHRQAPNNIRGGIDTGTVSVSAWQRRIILSAPLQIRCSFSVVRKRC
jgi:hypothetical protein